VVATLSIGNLNKLAHHDMCNLCIRLRNHKIQPSIELKDTLKSGHDDTPTQCLQTSTELSLSSNDDSNDSNGTESKRNKVRKKSRQSSNHHTMQSINQTFPRQVGSVIQPSFTSLYLLDIKNPAQFLPPLEISNHDIPLSH
jgi:hypothetical protein